jgi:hypothetical protein
MFYELHITPWYVTILTSVDATGRILVTGLATARLATVTILSRPSIGKNYKEEVETGNWVHL